MNLQIGVKVIIKNSKGLILLLKRTSQYSIPSETNDAWDIPGGRIDANEDLHSALVREVKEELGVDLVSTPVLIKAQDIFVSSKELHVVRLTYIHEMDVHSITLSDEHTGYEWVTIKEAKLLNIEPFLKEALQLIV